MDQHTSTTSMDVNLVLGTPTQSSFGTPENRTGAACPDTTCLGLPGRTAAPDRPPWQHPWPELSAVRPGSPMESGYSGGDQFAETERRPAARGSRQPGVVRRRTTEAVPPPGAMDSWKTFAHVRRRRRLGAFVSTKDLDLMHMKSLQLLFTCILLCCVVLYFVY